LVKSAFTSLDVLTLEGARMRESALVFPQLSSRLGLPAELPREE
jgi:hypothetical protein